jgi:hypothetical protein
VFVVLSLLGQEGCSKCIVFADTEKSTAFDKAASMTLVEERGSPRSSVNDAARRAYFETHLSLESFAVGDLELRVSGAEENWVRVDASASNPAIVDHSEQVNLKRAPPGSKDL